MKIRSLAVNQFRKFTEPVCLAGMRDGLNIVVGPNEMGKSTLLDALRAVLFEKHGSRARPVADLRNDRNQAAPVVELEFEMADGVHRVRKRFMKKPFASLHCPDGRHLEGDAAEQMLRELLDIDEPGKAGARPETIGMWNVLWVRQGQSFGALELPETARSSLHSALESEVGAVLGGKRGRALPQVIDEQLSKLRTATGKPRGDYRDALEQVERHRTQLDGLRERRKDLSDTLDALQADRDTLARLEAGDQDREDRDELEAARARHRDLAELEGLIGSAAVETRLREHDLERAGKAVAERRGMKESIESRRRDVGEAQATLEAVEERTKAVETALDGLKAALDLAVKADDAANETLGRERRIGEAAERAERVRGLQRQYRKARDAGKVRQAALRKASAILVTDEVIEAVRRADRKLEAARTRLGAVATRISFDMEPDGLSGIEIDGEALSPGQAPVEAVEPVVIAIPGRGRITVEPAVADRDVLRDREREALAELGSALDSGGAADAESAEQRFAERVKLLQEAELARREAELHAPGGADHDPGAESLGLHVEGLQAALEQEMESLGIAELPSRSEAGERIARAEARADEARKALGEARGALAGPEQELGRLRTELGTARARHDDGRAELGRLEGELAEAAQAESDDALGEAVERAREALAGQQRAAAELEARRTGEALPQLDARIERLEGAIRERRDKRTGLGERIAGHRSRIEVLEGAGLDETIERKAAETEQRERDLEQLEREVKVLSLLSETLRAAESEAKERYLSPVINRVGPYLRVLLSGARIEIDEDLHVRGVVREGEHSERFDHLSMGTQEQIAVLVRLAFAEMLVEQGHPATVILDDALVFSDDRRMQGMFDILNMVSRKVQVIVFTCREQLFEGIGGHYLSLEPGDPEDLPSA